MRALLVDDDVSLVEALSVAFQAAGYDVVVAHDGERGLREAQRPDVDLVVCDVTMPKLDGFAVCRRLRDGGSRVPFVLLTSRDTEIDEALGLELGADDYVTKPFSVRVLLARAAALLRRAAPPAAPEEPPLRAGPLEISRARMEVRFLGELIPVTVTELRLLEALVSRPGRVLSREQLLALGREDDSVVTPRIVDTYVARLRKKMDAIAASKGPSARGAARLIETVVGAGYRLRDDV